MEVDSVDTPKLVMDELSSVWIGATGNRDIDIPNFWRVMRIIGFTINSPKYLHIDAKLTWLSRERDDD